MSHTVVLQLCEQGTLENVRHLYALSINNTCKTNISLHNS